MIIIAVLLLSIGIVGLWVYFTTDSMEECYYCGAATIRDNDGRCTNCNGLLKLEKDTW